jgi:hypothetical protein
MKYIPFLRFFLLLLCFASTLPVLKAQVSNRATGTPDDYKAAKDRILVVEVLDETYKGIEKKYKGVKSEEDLLRYKNMVVQYNLTMQQSIGKYWKFNKEVLFRSAWGIDQLKEDKSKKYVVLSYYDIPDPSTEVKSLLVIPALRFRYLEKNDPDYFMIIPSTGTRLSTKYMDCDIKLALTCMQRNFEWIIENNKTEGFEAFAKAMTAKNCSRLSGLELKIEKPSLAKSLTATEAAQNYGKKVTFVKAEDVNTLFTTDSPGQAVLFSIPYDIKGGVTYCKLVVDCATGEILFYRKPSMDSGNFTVKKGDFKDMGKCEVD